MGRAPVMLRRKGDFAALQRSGKSKMHPLLVARFVPNDLGLTRFGLSTGRRLGGAVTRNRVRRRLRAALQAHAADFTPGWDVLIVARPASAQAAYPELHEAVRRVLTTGHVLRNDTSIPPVAGSVGPSPTGAGSAGAPSGHLTGSGATA